MAPARLDQTTHGTYLQLNCGGLLTFGFFQSSALTSRWLLLLAKALFRNCLHHMIERSLGNKRAAFWILEYSQVSCRFAESLLFLLSRPWPSPLWLLASLSTPLLYAHPTL